ncbi:SAM-dependent methyltransferase [Acrocarpospora catenulata]|uniref:SAM-dependent methyltransferase n=1 Tax=Acrocarpospora catenulata TaxID=2836182 RepID=UPI001BDB2E66|nr:SAM-dependent methyltransferase [Acrocarpospora catenulata]
MWLSWREAMARALYGAGGFYRRERPHRHFRTSVHVSPAFGAGVTRLLARVDRRLGGPAVLDFVDMGAGDGRLAAQVLAGAPPELAGRLRVTAVDLSDRPRDLDGRIRWAAAVPPGVTGLIFANEWLDNVPLDVARGSRLVLVDPATGAERDGGPPSERDREWLARWWPGGERAEIGWPRDDAWAELVAALERGMAVAVDYSHTRQTRPPLGTLTGYRDGQQVAPVPDGSRDLTAHVALDACAAAGERAGAAETVLTTQREALRELGVRGARPPLEQARTDPAGYLRALSLATAEAELIDATGLGAFGWLTQIR